MPDTGRRTSETGEGGGVNGTPSPICIFPTGASINLSSPSLSIDIKSSLPGLVGTLGNTLGGVTPGVTSGIFNVGSSYIVPPPGSCFAKSRGSGLFSFTDKSRSPGPKIGNSCTGETTGAGDGCDCALCSSANCLVISSSL